MRSITVMTVLAKKNKNNNNVKQTKKFRGTEPIN